MPATTGATLTEVLVALLIMGIGVTSVFTLFPIAILRAIQATQETNARITQFNTEELVAAAPLILNTHGTGNGIVRPAQMKPINRPPGFAGEWRPGLVYARGDLVVPTAKSGSPYPSPDRWFIRINEDPDPANAGALTGIVEPDWRLNAPTVDGECLWAPFQRIQMLPGPAPPVGVLHNDPTTPIVDANISFSTAHYVVDPLGWNIARADGWNLPNNFGNKTDDTTGFESGPISFPLLRLNGGILSEAAALRVATLPDTWETVVEGTPQSATPTSVTFASTGNVDLTALNARPGMVRVTLVSTDGSMSVVRVLDDDMFPLPPMSRTVNWPPSQPLPTRFPGMSAAAPAPEVGLARIEVFDRRYTWFLTVRKPVYEIDIDGDGALNNYEDVNRNGRVDREGLRQTEVKIVVVFNRRFLPEEEHVYDANFANPAVDVDGLGTADGQEHGIAGRTDWVKITWPAPEPEPLRKPGNFLFDPRNVRWYRIRDVFDEDPNASPPWAVLILDQTPLPTRDDGMGPPAGAVPTGRAILMRGIIDVYDL